MGGGADIPTVLRNSSVVAINGGNSTSFGVMLFSPLDVVGSRITGFTYAGRAGARCAHSIFGNGLIYQDNGTGKFVNCTDDSFNPIPNR
jgi:hypothetical protein